MVNKMNKRQTNKMNILRDKEWNAGLGTQNLFWMQFRTEERGMWTIIMHDRNWLVVWKEEEEEE